MSVSAYVHSKHLFDLRLVSHFSFFFFVLSFFLFFFQAEDGIRDRSPSRGLGDVYKRQVGTQPSWKITEIPGGGVDIFCN